MYCGIDVGRGYVKAVSEQIIKFPSYLAPYRELDIETNVSSSLDHLVVSINNQKWFVGELAKREGGSREFQKEKANHRNTIPLLITAIALSTYDNFVSPKTVIGLPISDYKKQASQFEKSAVGNYQVELQGKSFSIELHHSKILSFPEGAGILWDQILDKYGNIANEKLSKTNLAVLDIGWKTCNFAVLRNLQYDDSISGTLPMGLSRAFRTFYKRISREYDYSPAQAERLLAIEGQQELQRLAREIKDNMSMWWNEAALAEIDTLYLAGGGGMALSQYLDYDNKQIVKDAQISNARGFYKVAKAQMSE